MTTESKVSIRCPFSGSPCFDDHFENCSKKNCPTFLEAKEGKYGQDVERRARAYCPECGMDRANYYKMFGALHIHPEKGQS